MHWRLGHFMVNCFFVVFNTIQDAARSTVIVGRAGGLDALVNTTYQASSVMT